MLKREIKRFTKRFSPFQEFAGICLLLMIIAIPAATIFNLNAQTLPTSLNRSQVLGAEGQEKGISISVDEGQHAFIQLKDFNPTSSSSTALDFILKARQGEQLSRPAFTIHNSGSESARIEVTPSGTILSNTQIALVSKNGNREYILRNSSDGFKSNLIVVPATTSEQFYLAVKSPTRVNFDEQLELNVFIR